MYVLGIETSCDETACAVVRDGQAILSNVIASSLEEHRPYGGIIPEIACRSHVEFMTPVLEEALNTAGVSFEEIQLISATSGPGLPGSLLVGLSTAKALSFARGVPFIGVDHLQAHLYASLMRPHAPAFPLIGMVVSGGHTALFRIEELHRFQRIAETQDDACGEAFDKVARILGLGYPGGPHIEKRAEAGNPKAFSFPPPILNETSLDFSFSGIKTAVLYKVRELEMKQSSRGNVEGSALRAQSTGRKLSSVHCALRPKVINDICASFQHGVIETLIRQALHACRRFHAQVLLLGGGVVTNQKLRSEFRKRFRDAGLQVLFPPEGLSLDNAAMVAGLGYRLYQRGIRSPLDLACEPLGVH